MESIKKFLANKSIGYYISVGIALISLVLGIVFFATSKGTMPNSAASYVTQSVGIFLLVGGIIEVTFLVLPQYRFIHLITTFMYCLSLATELLIFAPLVAGKANNVEYEGGNFNYHLFYTIAIVLLLAICIVASFVGFFKSEDGLGEEMKISPKNPLKIGVVAACTVIIVGSIVGGKIIENNIRKGLNTAEVDDNDQEIDYSKDPNITDEMKAKAAELNYEFNPKEIIIKEKEPETYDYDNAELKALNTNGSRDGDHHLVYYFEGSYIEGYQGDYTPSYANIYLWEDGMYVGKIKDTTIRGYWYNSTLSSSGKDAEGNDVKDKVVLVSNISKYESMICRESSGFYDLSLYAFIDMGWGQRSMSLYGYYYYPDIATFIKYSDDVEDFKVGDTLDKGKFSTQHVLSNFKYGGVFKASEVSWTWPSGMLDSNNKFVAAGEFELKSKWGEFEATKTIVVKDAQ